MSHIQGSERYAKSPAGAEVIQALDDLTQASVTTDIQITRGLEQARIEHEAEVTQVGIGIQSEYNKNEAQRQDEKSKAEKERDEKVAELKRLIKETEKACEDKVKDIDHEHDTTHQQISLYETQENERLRVSRDKIIAHYSGCRVMREAMTSSRDEYEARRQQIDVWDDSARAKIADEQTQIAAHQQIIAEREAYRKACRAEQENNTVTISQKEAMYPRVTSLSDQLTEHIHMAEDTLVSPLNPADVNGRLNDMEQRAGFGAGRILQNNDSALDNLNRRNEELEAEIERARRTIVQSNFAIETSERTIAYLTEQLERLETLRRGLANDITKMAQAQTDLEYIASQRHRGLASVVSSELREEVFNEERLQRIRILVSRHGFKLEKPNFDPGALPIGLQVGYVTPRDHYIGEPSEDAASPVVPSSREDMLAAIQNMEAEIRRIGETVQPQKVSAIAQEARRGVGTTRITRNRE